MEGDTGSLRKAAPHWSLDGDKQLLGMLQKIHQKIMTKCEEANVKLDAMVDALDNASIDLQNVNNKFMALSNNQFVESRVYDDDVDVSTELNVSKIEPPVVEAESEITKLKRSLQKLEEMHEPIHILDSDSSDDEDDGRIILKPKEIYSHRPLPYIIGTQAWKSKWHAGLVQEESDSDSSVSKHDNIPAEEYSESEPETVPTDKLGQRTISSSSMESEVTSQPQPISQVTKQQAKPADIAAELARRLGGQPVQLATREPVEIQTPPEQTSKKVYRVEKPASTTIFSDEPPPLDDYQSYKSDYTDDDDIFAELHRKPNHSMNRNQNRLTKNSFGGLSDNIVDDLFGEVETCDDDIGNVIDYHDVKPSASGTQKPTDDRPQLQLTAEKPKPTPKPIEIVADTEGAVKKPVGGISLFGTNKGTESIGAAILKRNHRKSSTSDEDTNNAAVNKLKVQDVSKTKEEPVKKIIEGLFSKPTKKVTKKGETIRIEEPEIETPSKDKIDLFSDNLFDDIDDIFSTNIVTKPKNNKPQKSIFDDDDLFADITLKKPEKHSDKSDTKSIFDHDDDLFNENVNTFKTGDVISSINMNKDDVIPEGKVKVHVESEKNAKDTVTKGVFDNGDSEGDVFSDVKIVNEISQSRNPTIENAKQAMIITIHNDDKAPITETVNHKVSESINKSVLNPVSSKSQLESPSLFDDDEFDDLLGPQTKISIQSNLNNVEKNNHFIKNNKTPSLIIKSNPTDKEEIMKQSQSENEVVSRAFIEKNNVVAAETQISDLDDNEVVTSRDFIVKNNVVAVESHISDIPDKIVKSEISQPKENLAASDKTMRNDMLNEEQYTKSSYLTDVDDIYKKSEHLKHSKTLYENVHNVPPPDIIPEMATSESNESGLFSDMPPAFEKPLEPKKSKNVNALFDDDSDDESMFFKKNEIISDEKPDLNFSTDRFRIFHDEPPEIEVNFSPKPLKNTPSFLNELPDDELFGSLPKLQEQEKEIIQYTVAEVNECRQNIDLSKENNVTNVVDITKLIQESEESTNSKEINVSKLLENFEENTKTDLTENINEKSHISEKEKCINRVITEEIEPRKSIGKIKHMNFNINVNTLLPGASLKKSKTNEETDGQIISTKSNEELNVHSPEKSETKMVKSISFDGDPESEILDNNLSKQRAKIQVKRRPSSRRARLEAVRKSRIDLASDSTDNSSSFDEPPYKEIVNREMPEDTVDSNIIQAKSTSTDTLKKNTNTVDITNSSNIPPLPELFQKATDSLINTKTTEPAVKSKVVYILNDEDIFNDINPRKEENTESNKIQNKNILDIVDDDDEFLFKTPNISTLGKTYENQTILSRDYLKTEPKTTDSKENDQKNCGFVKAELPTVKKSIFDDVSDDENELFSSKNPAVQKPNTFDSDSESELFVKSKRGSNPTADVKKETIKGSLFGDESEDDSDLFGFKPGKPSGIKTQNIPKPKEVKATTSEPVFEDPLSMFSDDS